MAGGQAGITQTLTLPGGNGLGFGEQCDVGPAYTRDQHGTRSPYLRRCWRR